MMGLRPAVWVLTAMLAAGCAPERDSGPPRLRFGEIMCAECGMLVSEPRFAAAARTASGDVIAFDDTGCLLRHAGHAARLDWQLWVPAEPDGAWIDARTASFVHRADLATPMGYGLTAVAGAVDGSAMNFAAAAEAAARATPQPQGGSP